MTRQRDNFKTREDQRAGDFRWPEELQPQECSIDWMTAGVWWLMLFALAGFWACVFWLLGLI